MKKLLWGCAAAMVLGLGACKNAATDNNSGNGNKDATANLPSRIQEQIDRVAATTAQTDKMTQNYNQLGSQLKQDQAALKNDSAFIKFDYMVTGYQRRHDGNIDRHEYLAKDLKELQTKLTTGAITPEDAEKAYADYKMKLDYLIHDDSMFVENFNFLSTEYAKMVAEIKSKKESH